MYARHRRTELGAALIETAIVLPLLLILTLAAVDGGMFFKSYFTLAQAVRDGARAGTAAATDPDADYQLLNAAKKTIGTDENVERIVVYKADNFDDPPSDACMTGSGGVTGECNVYLPRDFTRAKEEFGGGNWGGDQKWSPLSRNDDRSEEPDIVGVAVKAEISTPVGIFGKRDWPVTLTKRMQVEARTS